jgi:hypothetical protein
LKTIWNVTASSCILGALCATTPAQIAADPAAPERPGAQAVVQPSGTTVSSVSRGVYVTLILGDLITEAREAAFNQTTTTDLPPYPGNAEQNAAVDSVLVNYFTALLNDPAVSGLAPQMSWTLFSLANPGPDPDHPAPGSDFWNPLDDVFKAVAQWNEANPGYPRKNIQLLLSSGNHLPAWVVTDIDDNSCGTSKKGACNGDCDGLFRTLPTVPAPSQNCGYTTIFWDVESLTALPTQPPLPMPWNNIYMKDWKGFLIGLKGQIAKEPHPEAFSMIAMSGPTASSTEMILPNQTNQMIDVECTKAGCVGCFPNASNKKTCMSNSGILTLPGPVPTKPGIDAGAAWEMLFLHKFGSSSPNLNSEGPFIRAWEETIDLYASIFSGVTLSLTTTTDALPWFTSSDASLYEPALGLSFDCDEPDFSPKLMECAAVTQVIHYFMSPGTGGKNSKATFEAGMTARRDGADLGTNGIKSLSAYFASGTTRLPPYEEPSQQVYGGLQFAHSFSDPSTEQFEGCPTYPKPECTTLTPSIGAENVFSRSFFNGTAAGPYFDAPTSVVQHNFNYSNAPMNFVQIYNGDILYAEGLSNCKLKEITGSPGVSPAIPPDTSACIAAPPEAYYEDALRAQAVLDVASTSLLLISEPVEPLIPPVY